MKFGNKMLKSMICKNTAKGNIKFDELLNLTSSLVPLGLTRYNQERMLINYGKLIPWES